MLTDHERERYEWQMWVPGHGEAGQEKLKKASVLVSRCGGVGSVVAYELAAAGVGTLILAHGGNVKPSDLNRQLLMTHDHLGKPRIESVTRRLKELNPFLNIISVESNITEDNVAELVSQADIVIDCAPLFNERFLMNREVVRQNKILIENAMFDCDAQLTTIIPGNTPCLSCIYPEDPGAWTREFPVFGAVSGTIACMAAMEAIKAISGFGKLLTNRLQLCDLRDMQFRTMHIQRNPDCAICGSHTA